MAGLTLSSVFGGGAQVAPQYSTLNPSTVQNQYLGQNFAGELNQSNNITQSASAGNLSTNLAGLNSFDPGAIQGINAEQNLGNTLMTGSSSALPAWATTYMNNAKMQGAQSAQNRGVGAFSGNGISGTNQYVGNNALQLVNMGAQFAGQASGQAQGITNANMYRNDPNNAVMSMPALSQIGEFNTGIQNEQANANTAVQNYNDNNSPWGNMTRTALQMVASLAGSYLGDSSLGNSFSTSGNGSGGPIQGASSGSGGGSGGGGMLAGMGMAMI